MSPTEAAIRDRHHLLPSRGGSEDIAFLLGVIDYLRAENTRLKERAACSCGALRRPRAGGAEVTHRPYCRLYVGPLTHAWVKIDWNGTFGGWDHFCSCGGWFRQGGIAGHGDGTEDATAVCPNADTNWKGPRS